VTQSATPARVLPTVNADNELFWTGGKDGVLRFMRCRPCARYYHPPAPVCPYCWSRDVGFEPVSGNATVIAVTVNYQPWIPGFDPPYAIAIVEMDEQPGLRMMTNIVDCDPETVAIGQRVHVIFEQHDTVFLPLFRPIRDASPRCHI